MLHLFKRLYLKRLTTKITVAYLSNPSVLPSLPDGTEDKIKEINRYVLNVLLMSSKKRKIYINKMLELP